jgi:sialidase-1
MNAKSIVWAAWAMLLLPLAAGAAEPEHQVVFQSGTKGYHTYRIPSLIVTTKGTLLAFCEGRKTGGSDHGDIDLMLRRSTDQGKNWSEQTVVHEQGGDARITIGNPCPVVDRSTGTIWLSFCRNNDAVLMTHSTDDGQSWTTPREITSQVKRDEWDWYATGPGHGIQIERGKHKGRLVFPCDHRTRAGEGSWRERGRSHVFYSDDHGQTFQLGQPTDWAMNECEVVERTDGTLLLSMRNYLDQQQRAFATSDDGGETWSASKHQDIYCPTCQASIHRLSWQPNVILYSGPGGQGRRNLTVRASYDDGQSWPAAKQLHEGPSAYSDLAALADGTIGCLHEVDGYRAITFSRFPLEWLGGEP